MKFAIISDLHIGDSHCALVEKKGSAFIKKDYYQNFIDAVGTDNDYLIILGDLFDIAVRDYKDVYEISSYFFDLIKKESIAHEIIYVPGNHDYSIWHTLEHQINVIDRFNKKKYPRQFKQTVPGLLDIRTASTTNRFILEGLTRSSKSQYPYGDVYLKNINLLHNYSYPETQTFFNISYPNLYFLTDTGAILLTHGQYFEPYWNLTSDWLPKICKNDPDFGTRLQNIDMKESIAINFPLSQLSSSGFGQAGIFTDIVRKLQYDVTSKNGTLVNSYVKNLIESIDISKNAGPIKRFILWLAQKYIIEFVEKKITTAIKADHSTIYQEIEKKCPETLNRFTEFMQRSQQELNTFAASENITPGAIPITQLIFGHTHTPLPFNCEPKRTFTFDNREIEYSNTGGWLYETINNVQTFCGAEVIRYSTEKGFESISVR